MCSHFAGSLPENWKPDALAPVCHGSGRCGLGARVLCSLIRLYRRHVSPYTMPSCRFTPTCSRYAMDAVRRYGALYGAWLALWRILRCNPICRGGYDPLR